MIVSRNVSSPQSSAFTNGVSPDLKDCKDSAFSRPRTRVEIRKKIPEARNGLYGQIVIRDSSVEVNYEGRERGRTRRRELRRTSGVQKRQYGPKATFPLSCSSSRFSSFRIKSLAVAVWDDDSAQSIYALSVVSLVHVGRHLQLSVFFFNTLGSTDNATIPTLNLTKHPA